MKALLCKAYGPPESLVLEEIASPTPGPGQVKIRVRACGVNFPDLLIIENKYQEHPPLPFAPGAEVAGDIVELGPDVTGLAVGDRGIGMLDWGGYQEETLCDAARCLPMPNDMDYDIAASFTLTCGTSFHALVDRGHLGAGETLLVLGASGGVGTAAIDIGRRLGARIIAAGGSDEKLAQVAQVYGVQDLINYNTLEEPLKDRVNALTDGKGADVIYDPIGGETFQQSLRCVGWEGRILVVGFASDGENLPQARTNLLLLKGSALIGVFWGRFTYENPMKIRENLSRLFDMYSAGELSPHISHRLPLSQGADAMYALANRKVVGKCVIVMD